MFSLSVIIPVKNGEAFISDSFKNALQNLRESDEIIYVDDNSTDRTFYFLQQLAVNCKNVRIVRNSGTGIVDALNYGILKAKNKWIARFDIDDICAVDRLDNQRKLISQEVVAIFCDYDFIDQHGNTMGQVLSPIFEFSIMCSLVLSQRTPHPGVIFSKEAYIKAGGYLISDFPAEDIALWLRMSQYGKIISTPKKLLKYRIHSKSITATKQNQVNLKRHEVMINYLNKEGISIMFNFRAEYEKYRMVNNSHERQILAIRDYYFYLNYFNLKSRATTHLIFYGLKIVINPKKLQILYRLIKEKRLRDKYRSSYSNFR